MEKITFSTIYPDSKPGEYGSIDQPSRYVHLDHERGVLSSPDEVVINSNSIKILYDYPLGTTGPSELEKEMRGWIFEEKTNLPSFTRKELVRVIQERYHIIYTEEENDCGVVGTINPRMMNRAFSDGKYSIWGHYLSDLDLHEVSRDDHHPEIFQLGIDS